MAKKKTKKKTAKKTAKKTTKRPAKKTTRKQSSAKRSSKKTARTSTRKKSKKKTTKKKTSKSTPRRKTAKKTAKPSGPQTIKTGRGATPGEIGESLVRMFNAGTDDAVIWDKWYHSKWESIEGSGMAYVGKRQIKAKAQEFFENNEIHGASAEGPFVGATGFSVRFRIDVTEKSSGNRLIMDEVGVFTVRNGKIIREEFMYGGVEPVNAVPEPEQVLFAQPA